MDKKRLNIAISEQAYSDLDGLATSTSRTMTEVIRIGLGLAKLAIEAESKGQRLMISNSDGSPVKEIVVPR